MKHMSHCTANEWSCECICQLWHGLLHNESKLCMCQDKGSEQLPLGQAGLCGSGLAVQRNLGH